MSDHNTTDLLKILARSANIPEELVDYLTTTHTSKVQGSDNAQVQKSLKSKETKRLVKKHRDASKANGTSLAKALEGDSADKPKLKAKENQRLEVANRIKQRAPNTLNIELYDSVEWKRRVENVDANVLSICKDSKGDGFNPLKRAKSTQDAVMFSEGSEPRTPLFAGMTPTEVKEAVLSLLTDEDMIDVELKFADKYGDFIKQPFDEWADNLFPFFEPVKTNIKEDTLQRAIREVYGEVADAIHDETGGLWLEPLSIEDAYGKVPSDGNSGYPFFTSKWNRDPHMVEYYLDQAERLLEGSNELIGTPHILWTRVQNDGEKSKIRPVECPAKSEAIAARAMTDKLINVMKTMTQFSGFNGGDNVHRYIAPMMNKEWLYSLDFSKFDANCQGIMGIVVKFVKTLYDPKYHSYFDNLLEFYQNVSLITPAGVMTGTGINGLMSGEGWTSLIGTFANAISIKYTLMRMEEDGKLNSRSSTCVLSFGDDIALASDERLPLDDLANYMLEVGMICNKDKQEETNGPKARFSFLGYYYFKHRWFEGIPTDAMPVFPIMRMLSSLVFQERSLHVGKLMATVKGMNLSDEDRDEVIKLLKDDQLDVFIMSTVMRLNNLRNHKDFSKMVAFVKSNAHIELTSDKVMPFSRLAEMFRGNRTSRNFGLAKSAIIQEMWVQENIAEYQFIDGTIEFQSIYAQCTDDVMGKLKLQNKMERVNTLYAQF
jgi:hypothetical protein